MNIQCPQCEARYRIKNFESLKSEASVTCPKCRYRFSVAAGRTDPQADGNTPVVLIVDDAKFFRELMIELLAARNVKVIQADRGRTAWETLVSTKVDLLIVDVNLPDISGYDLISRIRSEERFKALPILGISGVHRKEEDTLKALRAGANDFISKSFNPDEFNARIDKLIS